MQLRHGSLMAKQKQLDALQASIASKEAQLAAFADLPADMVAAKQVYQAKTARLDICRKELDESIARL